MTFWSGPAGQGPDEGDDAPVVADVLLAFLVPDDVRLGQRDLWRDAYVGQAVVQEVEVLEHVLARCAAVDVDAQARRSGGELLTQAMRSIHGLLPGTWRAARSAGRPGGRHPDGSWRVLRPAGAGSTQTRASDWAAWSKWYSKAAWTSARSPLRRASTRGVCRSAMARRSTWARDGDVRPQERLQRPPDALEGGVAREAHDVAVELRVGRGFRVGVASLGGLCASARRTPRAAGGPRR